MKKLVNGVEVEMTPAEEAAFENSRKPEPAIPPDVLKMQARHAWGASVGLTPAQADKLFALAQ